MRLALKATAFVAFAVGVLCAATTSPERRAAAQQGMGGPAVPWVKWAKGYPLDRSSLKTEAAAGKVDCMVQVFGGHHTTTIPFLKNDNPLNTVLSVVFVLRDSAKGGENPIDPARHGAIMKGVYLEGSSNDPNAGATYTASFTDLPPDTAYDVGVFVQFEQFNVFAPAAEYSVMTELGWVTTAAHNNGASWLWECSNTEFVGNWTADSIAKTASGSWKTRDWAGYNGNYEFPGGATSRSVFLRLWDEGGALRIAQIVQTPLPAGNGVSTHTFPLAMIIANAAASGFSIQIDDVHTIRDDWGDGVKNPQPAMFVMGEWQFLFF